MLGLRDFHRAPSNFKLTSTRISFYRVGSCSWIGRPERLSRRVHHPSQSNKAKRGLYRVRVWEERSAGSLSSRPVGSLSQVIKSFIIASLGVPRMIGVSRAAASQVICIVVICWAFLRSAVMSLIITTTGVPRQWQCRGCLKSNRCIR